MELFKKYAPTRMCCDNPHVEPMTTVTLRISQKTLDAIREIAASSNEKYTKIIRDDLERIYG